MTFIDNILNYDDGIDDRNNVHRPQPLKKDDKMDTIFCMKIQKQICEKKQLEPHVHLHPPSCPTPNVYMYAYMKLLSSQIFLHISFTNEPQKYSVKLNTECNRVSLSEHYFVSLVPAICNHISCAQVHELHSRLFSGIYIYIYRYIYIYIYIYILFI